MKKEIFSHDFDKNSSVTLGVDGTRAQLILDTDLVYLVGKAKEKAGNGTFGKILSAALDLGLKYLAPEEAARAVASSSVEPAPNLPAGVTAPEAKNKANV